jgi:hypothetical protein
MTFADDALLQQTETAVKQRFREHLPPRTGIAEHLRHVHRHLKR